MVLDKNSCTPLYQQVADCLRQEIAENRYGVHGNIGTHSQIAKRFDVSMITVRKAVQILADENLVDIKQGKGTFVKNLFIRDNQNVFTGASVVLNKNNIQGSTHVRRFSRMETPAWLPEDLKKLLGEECFYLQRIHSIDGDPVACADIYLPAGYGERMTKEDVELYTIYQIYQNKLGVSLGRGRQRIRANRAQGEAAGLLLIEPGSPVLEIERYAYDAGDNLIEYMLLTYEYDKYVFEVELALSAD